MHSVYSLAQKSAGVLLHQGPTVVLLMEQELLRLTARRGLLNLSQDLEMRLFRVTNEEKNSFTHFVRGGSTIGTFNQF